MTNSEDLLAQFEGLEISAPDFHHADHVKVAYGMLGKYDFIDAAARSQFLLPDKGVSNLS